jgi:hypothetical protein
MNHFGDEGPEGLERIEEVLRQERATAEPLELDRIKVRAMSQAKRAPRAGVRGVWARSRMVTVLTTMVVAFGTPTALAVCGGGGGGGSQGGSGGYGQYGPPPCDGNHYWDGSHCRVPPHHYSWHWFFGDCWQWNGHSYFWGRGWGWGYY